MANVNFTNIKSIGLPFGACPIGIDGLTEDLIAENGGIINATQIDWNGAQVAGKTLNTTGEVLSLIGDNITDIENVASSLRNHSHSGYLTSVTAHAHSHSHNYATTSHSHSGYLTSVTAHAHRHLHSGYLTNVTSHTHIHSHNYAETAYFADWSYLTYEAEKWQYSSLIQIGNKSNELNANSHINYTLADIGAASTSHSHSNYKTSIEILEDQITYLTSRINDLEELIGGGSVTPTIPEITGVTVKVTGGIYGDDGKYGTLNDKYEMHQYSDGTFDTLEFVLTANPDTADARFMIEYDDNSNGDINDTFVTVSTSQITNGLRVTVKEKNNSEEWSDTDDTDWTRYKVEAINNNSVNDYNNPFSNTLFLNLSYVYIDDDIEYWYAGQTQPTSMSTNPTVDDINFINNKWHTLSDGATQINQGVQGGTSGNNWYVAFPESFGFEIKASDLVTTDTTATKLSNITINNKTYNVYKLNSTANRTTIYAAKK